MACSPNSFIPVMPYNVLYILVIFLSQKYFSEDFRRRNVAYSQTHYITPFRLFWEFIKIELFLTGGQLS